MLEDDTFGLNFLAYYQECQSIGVTPKGRVFIAMIACRWRGDRRKARTQTIFNLMQIQLEGHSDKQVQSFCDKVQYHDSE